jgi:hypothetical protein
LAGIGATESDEFQAHHLNNCRVRRCTELPLTYNSALPESWANCSIQKIFMEANFINLRDIDTFVEKISDI